MFIPCCGDKLCMSSVCVFNQWIAFFLSILICISHKSYHQAGARQYRLEASSKLTSSYCTQFSFVCLKKVYIYMVISCVWIAPGVNESIMQSTQLYYLIFFRKKVEKFIKKIKRNITIDRMVSGRLHEGENEVREKWVLSCRRRRKKKQTKKRMPTEQKTRNEQSMHICTHSTQTILKCTTRRETYIHNRAALWVFGEFITKCTF